MEEITITLDASAMDMLTQKAQERGMTESQMVEYLIRSAWQ